MNTEELTSWSTVIQDYIKNLGDEQKKGAYIDELLSIYFSKALLIPNAITPEDEAELGKIKNRVINTKTTAANRVKFECIYQELRDRKLIEDLSKDIAFIKNKDNFYNIWICRSVALSEGVIPGTHIAKLSHSSSAASSILDRNNIQNNKYVTTSSLSKEIIDGTYTDARLSKQVKFLLLENQGSKLFDEILKGNYMVFSGFEDNSNELQYWTKKYTTFLSAQPKTDFLLKQIYFPVNDNYHLLSPLTSSSLAQKIYNSHFSKDTRKINSVIQKTRNSERYSDDTSVRISSVARLLVTQSQPQNVSVLNGRRGGAIRLFSSQPPTWQSQIKPPIHNKSWFDRGVPLSIIKEDIDYLRNFLLRFERIELSTKDPKKRNWLIKWAGRIISNVLFCAEGIQNLESGWSNVSNIKLKPEQQYFLDPYRDDRTFQTAKEASNWQDIVSNDFALWLNQKMRGKDRKFTPKAEHSKLWKDLMLQQLREHNQMVNVVLATMKEE